MFFSARICFSAQICFSVHKYIFQCTNLFFSAQICFSVHKYIFQCTNLFFSAQIYFQCTNICFSVHEYVSVHKYVFQCTNIFSTAQIYFPLHKYVTGYDGDQVTIVFPRLTGCHFASQRASEPYLKGFLIPYWKACFVPSVELKCKFPLHFARAVAEA